MERNTNEMLKAFELIKGKIDLFSFAKGFDAGVESFKERRFSMAKVIINKLNKEAFLDNADFNKYINNDERNPFKLICVAVNYIILDHMMPMIYLESNKTKLKQTEQYILYRMKREGFIY